MKAKTGVATVRWRMKPSFFGGILSVLAILPAPAAPVPDAPVSAVPAPPAAPVPDNSATPAPTPRQRQIEVDVKLVIATDVSLSITDAEEALQRQGIADLFLEPEVVRAIQSGPRGAIAVAMLDWAGHREDKVVVDWTIVQDKASAAALSEKIVRIGRMPGHRTSISNAITRSIDLLSASDSKILSARKVIDVSGDGPNNDGVSLEQVHRETANNGITVNGLPMMDRSAEGYFPDLDRYYGACVVSGINGFLLTVTSYKDFGNAMRRKLVLEISQDQGQIKQVLGELQPNPLLKTIAAGKTVSQIRPLLQKAVPEYPGGCDKYGGWKTNIGGSIP